MFEVAYAAMFALLPYAVVRENLTLAALACAALSWLEGGQDLLSVGRRPIWLRFLGKTNKETLLFAARHAAVLWTALTVRHGAPHLTVYLAAVVAFHAPLTFWVNSAGKLASAKVPFVWQQPGIAPGLWKLVTDYSGAHRRRQTACARLTEVALPAALVGACALGPLAASAVLGAVTLGFAAYFLGTGLWYRHTCAALVASQPSRVKAQLAEYAPEVMLYFSGGRNTGYQASMWFKPLEQTGLKTMIVFRERHHIDEFEPTSLPAVFLDTTRDLEFVIPDGIKVTLYAANVGKNMQWLRTLRCKHVFIGHGDSDKTGSAHNLMKAYDHMLVAGQAHIERMRAAGFERPDDYYIKIGRPQLELFFGPV